MTETYNRPGTRPGTATEAGMKASSSARRQSRPVDIEMPKKQVLSGKALKAWIIDKGFDGATTQAQRDRPRERGKESSDKDTKAPYGHRMRLGENRNKSKSS